MLFGHFSYFDEIRLIRIVGLSGGIVPISILEWINVLPHTTYVFLLRIQILIDLVTPIKYEIIASLLLHFALPNW